MKEIRLTKDLLDIKESYICWSDFLKQKVEFWLVNSDYHTKQHCSRVLLLALLLGKQNHLGTADMEALAMAAVFHDSRRKDDWLDVGHGQHAADYYKEYCKKHDLFYDSRTYVIMAYHDQPDEKGFHFIENNRELEASDKLLYQIFKDADALDRFRLGPDALDIKYLRTSQAKELVDFAKELLEIGVEQVWKAYRLL